MTGGNDEHRTERNTDTLCDEAAVRGQLETILQSPAFAGSPQLRSFLSYVVDQKLTGNERHIKGYTIAVEALGRATSFDPAADPIIRVEAARLRRLLDEYYEGPGADDPVLIDIPKGGYVPVFQPRETAPDPIQDVTSSSTAPRRQKMLRVALATGLALGLMLVLGLAAYMLLPRFAAQHETPATVQEAAVESPGVPLFKGELPRVHVAEIAIDGTGRQSASFSPAKVRKNLAGALRLFSEIELSETAAEADYRVEGRASFTDGKILLSFILVYTPDQEIIWSALFDLTYDRNAADLAEDRIVRNIAGAIARPYGVIFSHVARHRGDPSQVSEGFRCVLLSFNAQRRFAPDINARSRDCLTSLAGGQANFAPAHALLPMLYVDNARFGDKSDQERQDTLIQALTLAKHAVAATPDSARAYQALQSVLLFLGHNEEALQAGQQARRLNPYDTEIMATHGSTLIMLGDEEEGLELMLQARQQSPGHPAWYNTMIVFGAYGKGDQPLARKEATQIQNDETLSGLLARILVAHGDGRAKESAELLNKLLALRPEFGTDPHAALRRVFPSPTLRKQLLGALRAAGLKSPT